MAHAEERVISRNGEIGIPTGNTQKCRLEGCRGIRLSVKWPDNRYTYPCTKGMTYNIEKKEWQIR